MKKTFYPPKMELLRFSLNDSIASGCTYYTVWIGPNAESGNKGTGNYTVYSPQGEVMEVGRAKLNRLGTYAEDLDGSLDTVRSWTEGSCFSS